MRRILFVSRQRIVGRTNGSSFYLLDLADAVRAAGMVPHLVQPSPSIMGRSPFVRLQPDLAVFASHRVRGVIRIGALLISPDPRVYGAALRAVAARLARRIGVTAAWARDRPMPYSVALPWTEADRRAMRAAGRIRPDVVVADYMFQAEAFACLAERVPTAIVMHDLFHAREGGSGDGSRRDSVAAVGRCEEIALLSRADAVIAIQAAEADFVRAHVPQAQVILAPVAARPAAAAQPGVADRLLFVGSNTAPNVVGLQWFFDRVWPAVVAARPGVRLDIAGSVARAFGGAPAGVRFLGLVDDLARRYARAGTVISPLTFGSGLKVKLIEGMAAGKAIVATSTTIQGVEAQCAGAILVEDDADGFARSLIALQGDAAARLRMGELALAAARRHFAPEACYRSFVAWAATATAPSAPGEASEFD